ncbi:hypothetical protein GGF31_001806, partial [Allomyces arbusculus]
VSPRVIKRAVCNPAEKKCLFMSINSGFYETEYIYLAEQIPGAHDKDNYLCPGEFVVPIKAFITQVPPIGIQPHMIEAVDADKLDDVAQMTEQAFARIMEQKRVQIEAMQRKHEEDLAELRKQRVQNRALIDQHRAESQQRFEALERERRIAEERCHEAQLALVQQCGAKELELLQLKLDLERSQQDPAKAAERENKAKVELTQSHEDDDADDFSFRGVNLYEMEVASATLERESKDESSTKPSFRDDFMNGLEAVLNPPTKAKQKSSFRRSL